MAKTPTKTEAKQGALVALCKISASGQKAVAGEIFVPATDAIRKQLLERGLARDPNDAEAALATQMKLAAPALDETKDAQSDDVDIVG